MSADLPKRFKQYLHYVPCHPTLRREDAEWALLWNARFRSVFARFSFLPACLLVAASIVVWPYFAITRAWMLSGRLRKKEGGLDRCRMRVFLRLAICSLRYRLRPGESYRFGLVGDSVHASTSRVYLSEALGLPLLAAWNDRDQVDVLGDKKRFADFLTERGIRTVPVLAVVGTGELDQVLDFERLAADLIFKPCRGSRSVGVERWDWEDGAYRKGFAEDLLGLGELRQRLLGLSVERDYIVQPRLRNHPALEDLSNGSVIVFRVLTVRFGGRIHVLAPVAQLPYENEVDAVWREFVVAVEVGLESGKLERIMNKDEGLARADVHPSTRAPIVGRIVPDWGSGVALLCEAHGALPGIILVGWDLVFTPEGPVILEGNSGPALAMHQVLPLPPLRETVLWEALLAKAESGA